MLADRANAYGERRVSWPVGEQPTDERSLTRSVALASTVRPACIRGRCPVLPAGGAVIVRGPYNLSVRCCGRPGADARVLEFAVLRTGSSGDAARCSSGCRTRSGELVRRLGGRPR